MKVINIFLASSEELRAERDAFELFVLRLNDQLAERDIRLKVTRWENFFDAMSATRLQDEYNKKVREAQIFVSLFASKSGKFTQEEFEVAFGQFTATGKPYIYTYFRNTEFNTATAPREALLSLWKFQDDLKALGHFPTNYANSEALQLHFRGQLENYLLPKLLA